MATSILFVFSLCVFLCAVAVSSKPAQDLGSLQPLRGVDSVTLKSALKLDTVFSSKFESARALEQVKSLDSVLVPSLTYTGVSLSRHKRQIINADGQCPDGTLRFMKRCMPFELYERLVKEEEEEK